MFITSLITVAKPADKKQLKKVFWITVRGVGVQCCPSWWGGPGGRLKGDGHTESIVVRQRSGKEW